MDRLPEMSMVPEPQDQTIERQKPSKFEMYFDVPYRELKTVLTESLKPGMSVIDIGAYQGGLEDFMDSLGEPLAVECVDLDEDALNVLKDKQYKNLETRVVHSDANQFIDNRELSADQDAILLSATLHEINDVADQRGYLQHLLEQARGMLRDGGVIVIGDFYFPETVSDEEFERFRAFQLQAINHADARNKFINPQLIREVSEEVGFKVESFREVQAVEGIDRRYYVIVLKKVERQQNR